MENYFSRFLNEFWKAIKPGGRDIASEIKEAIDYTPIYYINAGSLRIPVTAAMISILITVIIAIVLAVIVGKKLRKDNIASSQAFFEIVYEGVKSVCASSGLSDAQADKVIPHIFATAFLITVSNVIGYFRFTPAASNPAFALFLAVFIILWVIVTGIRLTGFKGFLASLAAPAPALAPFNILDYFIKPISMMFRLFGNVFGAFILIEFLTSIVPLALPAVFGLWFDIGDGLIQAAVFSYLSIVYLGEIVEKSQAKAAVEKTQSEKNKDLASA